jgi:hypothetical protein
MGSAPFTASANNNPPEDTKNNYPSFRAERSGDPESSYFSGKPLDSRFRGNDERSLLPYVFVRPFWTLLDDLNP